MPLFNQSQSTPIDHLFASMGYGHLARQGARRAARPASSAGPYYVGNASINPNYYTTGAGAAAYDPFTGEEHPRLAAALMQSALESLHQIGAGNVTVTAAGPRAFDIAFQGAMRSFNQAAFTPTLVVSGPTAVGLSINEVFAGAIGNFGKHGAGTLTMSGATVSDYTATVRVTGTNGLGAHVTGTARITVGGAS